MSSVDSALLTPADISWRLRPDLGPEARQRQLSDAMSRLIDQTRLPVPNTPAPDWDHEIALYFIKRVTKPLNNRIIGGLALTDAGGFDGLPATTAAPLDEEPRHQLGVAFVFTDNIEGTAGTGIDVAHEIAHLVFGPFHTQKKAGNAYDIPVSILWGIRTPPDSPLQRRFTTGQMEQVRRNAGKGNRFIRK